METNPVVAYLSLGSNLEDRLENLRRSFRYLCQAGIALRRTSSVYETEPVDNVQQDWFLNCVAEIATTLPPETLLQKLQRIELRLGRERTSPKGPRTLDIDILTYGELVLTNKELTVPHPRMLERRFVLEPLRELAPALLIPGTGRTVEMAFQELRSSAKVRLFIKTLCA